MADQLGADLAPGITRLAELAGSHAAGATDLGWIDELADVPPGSPPPLTASEMREFAGLLARLSDPALVAEARLAVVPLTGLPSPDRFAADCRTEAEQVVLARRELPAVPEVDWSRLAALSGQARDQLASWVSWMADRVREQLRSPRPWSAEALADLGAQREGVWLDRAATIGGLLDAAVPQAAARISTAVRPGQGGRSSADDPAGPPAGQGGRPIGAQPGRARQGVAECRGDPTRRHLRRAPGVAQG
jgi:hypothetical protein